MEVTALDAALPLRARFTRDRRLVTIVAAAAALLLALIAGAAVAPSAPSPLASRLRVHEYFVAHHDAAFNQSILMHGFGGVALVVLVVAPWRVFADGWPRRAFLAAGLAAAAVSFAQLYFVFRIEQHIEHGIGVRQTDVLFDGLNRACALKFVFLAVAVAAGASLARSRRVKWLAWVAAPLLIMAAAASVTKVPSPHALLLFTSS